MLRNFACGALALAVGGCAVGGVPLFKKSEKTEEMLPDVHPIRKERATLAAKKFDAERNNAEFQAASAEWRQGNFKACREGIDKILYRDPAHRDSLILLAELELEHDQPELAVDILRRGIEAHPKDGEMSYKLGLALESAGESSEALHHFHVAVQLSPQEKKYAEVFKHAEEHAQQAHQQDKESAKTAIVADSHQPDVASEIQLTSAQSSTASDSVPSTELTPIENAAADWEAGRKFAAEKKVGKLLAHDPKHIEANILQVEIDLDAGRNDEARARIERLAIRNPHNAQVRRACALLYTSLGDEARAASAFAAAETLELGAIEDATPRIRPAPSETIPTVSNSSASETLNHAGPFSSDALPLQPEPSTTATFARKSTLEISPPNVLDLEAHSSPLPIADSGTSSTELASVETPIQLPQEEFATVDASKVKLTAQQLLDKGEVFLKAGRFDDAERELSAAIASKSCVVKTASAAALAPLKYEQSALALRIAHEGCVKFPDSASLHRIEGTAALRLGRHLEAEAALRQSLSLDNSQALTYFLLGSVYDRLGNQEAAERHLRQAARLDRRYATRK